ncbi:MAG: putative S-layer protein, partial [Nanoarchaeota archaeon]
FGFIATDDVADILLCGFYSDISGEFELFDDPNNPFNTRKGELKIFAVGTREGIPDGTYVWNIECSDGTNKAFAPRNFRFTVDENDPPEFDMETEYMVNENELLRIEAFAMDPEGEEVRYSINDARFQQQDNVFTWQTNYNDAGEYYFIITASDGEMHSDLEIHVIVKNVNRTPLLIRNIGDKNTDEDISFEINLRDHFVDPDDDALTFSYRDGDNLNIVFNNGRATITPRLNWNGETFLTFKASDGELHVESNEFIVSVNPVNDAPVLDAFDDITVEENEVVEIIANADDADDDQLAYYINDERFEKEGNIFRWATGIFDSGEYLFRVNVTDGRLWDEKNVRVIVSNANINPVLDTIGEIRIDEDSGQQEVWDLSASDEDGREEDLFFVVHRNSKAQCSVTGNKLNVNPKRDFFGETGCVVRVSDRDGGFDEQEVMIIVNGVDDPLRLKKAFPDTNEVVIGKNRVQNFFIEYEDVDNDPVDIKWFKDGEPVSRQTTYTFLSNGIEREYEIKVEISDGISDPIERAWRLIVREDSHNELTCSDIGGFVCANERLCKGQLLDSGDGAICCSTRCLFTESGDNERNETIINKESCVNGTVGDLKIKIKEPDDGDDFAPKSLINVEVEAENTGDKDIKDVVVEAFLFVKDFKEGVLDKIEDAESDETDIDEDDEETFEFELEVPDSDIDEDDEYVLFVKAFEDGDEDKQCAEDEIEIVIEREKHQVLIDEFNILNEEISCGDILRTELRLENLGKSEEEDMYVLLKIPQLNLETKSSMFTLEKFDENSDISKTIILKISDDVKAGAYKVVAEAVFDDGDQTESEEKTIDIKECKVLEVKKESRTEITLESVFERMPGDIITFPVEITNTGDGFAEYQIIISDSGLIDPITRNVLIAGNKKEVVNIDSVIKENAPNGEHAIAIDVMSEGRLIDSKRLIVSINRPEEVKESPKVVYTLSFMNLLAIIVLIYLLSLLIR